jgi:hypothetical protein
VRVRRHLEPHADVRVRGPEGRPQEQPARRHEHVAADVADASVHLAQVHAVAHAAAGPEAHGDDAAVGPRLEARAARLRVLEREPGQRLAAGDDEPLGQEAAEAKLDGRGAEALVEADAVLPSARGGRGVGGRGGCAEGEEEQQGREAAHGS